MAMSKSWVGSSWPRGREKGGESGENLSRGDGKISSLEIAKWETIIGDHDSRTGKPFVPKVQAPKIGSVGQFLAETSFLAKNALSTQHESTQNSPLTQFDPRHGRVRVSRITFVAPVPKCHFYGNINFPIGIGHKLCIGTGWLYQARIELLSDVSNLN